MSMQLDFVDDCVHLCCGGGGVKPLPSHEECLQDLEEEVPKNKHRK